MNTAKMLALGLLGGRAFSPLSIPGLKLWVRADAGLTLSTTGYTGTGTTVAQSGNTLTGVATKFLSEVVIGDNITGAGGLNGNVTAIASDTSLTLDSSATIGAETPYTITPVAGVSDRVTGWADQSGNGNNAIQSTLSRCPIKKSGTKNSLPSVLFDGQTDRLVLGSDITPLALTVFAVFKASVVSNQTMLGGKDTGGFSFDLTALHVRGVKTNSTLIGQNTNVLIAGSFYIADFTFATPNYALRVNGVDDGSGSQATTFTTTTNGIGAQLTGTGAPNAFFANHLLEMIYYDSVLSPANIVTVENYLNSRWAVF